MFKFGSIFCEEKHWIIIEYGLKLCDLCLIRMSKTRSEFYTKGYKYDHETVSDFDIIVILDSF